MCKITSYFISNEIEARRGWEEGKLIDETAILPHLKLAKLDAVRSIDRSIVGRETCPSSTETKEKTFILAVKEKSFPLFLGGFHEERGTMDRGQSVTRFRIKRVPSGLSVYQSTPAFADCSRE